MIGGQILGQHTSITSTVSLEKRQSKDSGHNILLHGILATQLGFDSFMYHQTFFFSCRNLSHNNTAEKHQTINRRDFSGTRWHEKIPHPVGESQKAYWFTLTDIFPQQHIGENTCGHAGYMWKPGHSLGREPSQAILKQYTGRLNTSRWQNGKL